MNTDTALLVRARNILESASSVVITNHVNPDGDAMGSAVGLLSVLKRKNVKAQVIVPNRYPDFLKWMEEEDTILFFEEKPERCQECIEKADVIVHLDYNALSRSGIMQEALQQAKATRIMIDHHQEPEDFADLMFSDSSMSSTCEMIYHFLEGAQWLESLPQFGAECLYTGIMTDTGNFRFNSTTSETHRVAGALLEKGVQPNAMASRIYDTNTRNRLKLLGRALETMELVSDFPVAIIQLSEEELKRYHFKKGDTEGFVNYGLSILGIKVSVFMVEKEGKIKISFRSKGDFDVNQLARKHFNGGGHKNAAGGMSTESLSSTIQRFKKILHEYNFE